MPCANAQVCGTSFNKSPVRLALIELMLKHLWAVSCPHRTQVKIFVGHLRVKLDLQSVRNLFARKHNLWTPEYRHPLIRAAACPRQGLRAFASATRYHGAAECTTLFSCEFGFRCLSRKKGRVLALWRQTQLVVARATVSARSATYSPQLVDACDPYAILRVCRLALPDVILVLSKSF